VLVLVSVSSLDAAPGTTLEAALLRAYNGGVKAGKWAEIFSGIGLVSGQPGCSGNAEPFEWPFPTQGTDLQKALAKGAFRCAFPSNTVISSTKGVIINSTLNNKGKPTGAVVDWFDYLATLIAAEYKISFQITWDTSYVSEEGVIEAVRSGNADAACGRFEPSLTYKTDAAASHLSFIQCPTYLTRPLVWVRKNANVFSWNELVGKVDNQKWKLCATPEESTYLCSNILNQYSTTNPGCTTTLSTTSAFSKLLNENGCDAVYGSTPSQDILDDHSLNSFPNPAILAKGTYMRDEDVTAQIPANLNVAVLNIPKLL